MNIKRCPFCRSDARVCGRVSSFAVACTSRKCEAVGPYRTSEKEAIAAWNHQLKTPTHTRYLARNLRKYLARKKCSIAQLTAMTGVAYSTINGICHQRYMNRMDTIQLLADSLEVDIGDLLEAYPGEMEADTE